MKNILKKIKDHNELITRVDKDTCIGPSSKDRRRDFLKKVTFGGISLSTMFGMSIEDTLAHSTSKVNRFSPPSDLKITDLRYVTLDNGTSYTNARNVIIRIDTNQGIYG